MDRLLDGAVYLPLLSASSCRICTMARATSNSAFSFLWRIVSTNMSSFLKARDGGRQ